LNQSGALVVAAIGLVVVKKVVFAASAFYYAAAELGDVVGAEGDGGEAELKEAEWVGHGRYFLNKAG